MAEHKVHQLEDRERPRELLLLALLFQSQAGRVALGELFQLLELVALMALQRFQELLLLVYLAHNGYQMAQIQLLEFQELE
jgi:hypothetical protein